MKHVKRLPPTRINSALRWTSLALLATVWLGSAAAMAGELSLSQLEGYYSTPSHCSFVEEGKSVPCDPQDTDWLKIEKVDAKHAKFHVYSDQQNSSQCEVEGVATWDGHALTYKVSDPKNNSFGHGFRIEFNDGKITFTYLPDFGPPKYLQPFCGAQASLEAVVFPLP
jgi:hypothetical protein